MPIKLTFLAGIRLAGGVAATTAMTAPEHPSWGIAGLTVPRPPRMFILAEIHAERHPFPLHPCPVIVESYGLIWPDR